MPGEPSSEEWQTAETVLRAIPEYRWLTDSEKPFYTTGEVGEKLGLSAHSVRGICERGAIRGATFYEEIGWRIPRSGLLVYCAQRVRDQATG